MGNSSSQSLSSSTVNGVTVHDQQSSSCGWYNPFCSSSNSGTMTQVGASAPFVVGTMAAVVILILLTLTVIHRYRVSLAETKQRVANKLKHLFLSSSRKIPESELEFVNMQEIV